MSEWTLEDAITALRASVDGELADFIIGYVSDLKEKERARSQIIDTQQQKTVELDRMLDISNMILNDYKDKWQRALQKITVLEEDLKNSRDFNPKDDTIRRQKIEIDRLRADIDGLKALQEISRLKAEIVGLRMDAILGR